MNRCVILTNHFNLLLHISCLNDCSNGAVPISNTTYCVSTLPRHFALYGLKPIIIILLLLLIIIIFISRYPESHKPIRLATLIGVLLMNTVGVLQPAVTKFPTKYFRIEFMRREFVVRVIGTLLVVLYLLYIY